MTSKNGETISDTTIREAKRGLSRDLLRLPGVSGVGIEADETGSEYIKVYLAEDDPVLASSIPESADGYPVVTEVIGPIHARSVAPE